MRLLVALAAASSISALAAEEIPTFAARKAEIATQLAREDFAGALAGALALNRDRPDDIGGYQLIATARLGLGDYSEAEKSCQWMLDLALGKADSYGSLLIARIREATGDYDGAIDSINAGYAKLLPEQTAERRTMAIYSGELLYRAGKLELAARVLERLPDAPLDVERAAALAAVRLAQSRRQEGVALLRTVAKSPNPHPKYLYQLAAATGNESDYREFERAATSIRTSDRNANRELSLYYAGQGRQPRESLEIAKAESERRHDLWTLDALAMAYHANRRDAESKAVMRRILDVGTRDPEILRHAKQLGVQP